MLIMEFCIRSNQWIACNEIEQNFFLEIAKMKELYDILY